MKDYLRMLKFLEGHKGLFRLTVTIMFIASFFEGIQLTLLVPMFDRIFTNKAIIIPNKVPAFAARLIEKINSIEPSSLFWSLPLIIFALLLIKQLMIFCYQYFMNDISNRITRDVRNKVYEKIQHLSLEYFSTKRTGELVGRITGDVQLIENTISYGLVDLFRQTFLIFFYIATAFFIYAKAAIIIFCVFPLLTIPISQIGKKLRKLSKSSQEKFADLNSLLIETISGIKVVKAFCMENYEIERFKKKSQEMYKIVMKSVKRLLAINPITEIYGTICGVVMFLWLGSKVMGQEISLGIFVLFFASLMSIISPVKKLGNTHAMIQKALAANDRIYEVLDAEIVVKEKPNAVVLKEMREKISLENVYFHYDKKSQDVLKDIDLEIKKGQLMAIVGPTGTGKTSLVNLIPRFYDPTGGRVKMDGIDLKDATLKSLRDQIGIVTQESILFNDTVRANIAYGHLEATQEEIEEAAKKAYAHQFVAKMPQGYDTVIGDRGFRLSGGEKQRISIARAILKNPPVLILDEATSQLDSEAEKLVQEALDKLMEGRTVIAIAHRLSTIMKADKIVILEEGRIVGEDKHDDLLQSSSLYKKLFTLQFQV